MGLKISRDFSRSRGGVTGFRVDPNHGYNVFHDFGHKHGQYILCDDGGHRDAGGQPDPDTWTNMFGAAPGGTRRR